MCWLIRDPARMSHRRQRHLLAATPTWKGDYMREAMRQVNDHGPGNYLAVILYDHLELIGWAMLDFRLSTQRSVRTYVYVRTKYRRRGHGTKIVERARKLIEGMGKDIRVLPHDRRSKRFFKKIGMRKRQVAYGYKLEE